MKLIVLYGPENSGKTITLKIVYERLKKYNLLETHWFRYYDHDRAHLDFRDVLVFPYIDNRVLKDKSEEDSTEIENILASLSELNQNNTNSFKLSLESKRKKQKASTKNVPEEIETEKKLNWCESFPLQPYTQSEFGRKIQKFEDYNKSMFPKESEYEPAYGDDLIPIGCYKVGFVLEGDFGFVHTSNYWAQNNRNLYKHLLELVNCDTIICACSELSANTPVQQKPLLCIAFFAIYCFLNNIPIQLFHVNSISLTDKHWTTRNIENEKIANQIIQLI